MNNKHSKNSRTLSMYVRLCAGKRINKAEEANRFGVDERSIQRDIDDIRAFLEDQKAESTAESREIVYDRIHKGFVMTGTDGSAMSNSEILAVSKILLESRAFGKNIIHAAAYIYNLCRDFDTLDPSSDEYYSLMQFALGMRMDLRNMKENLKTMVKLSNIDNISDIIKTELAKNYEELLTQDIDKKYKDIKYTLKRVAKNSQAKVGDLINVSFKGMDELNKKVEEQEKNLKEIKDCEAQLEDLLEAMKKRTQKRLDQILPELDKACKNNRKKK